MNGMDNMGNLSDLSNLERFLFETGASIVDPVCIHETDDGRLIVSIRVDPDTTRETLEASIPRALKLRDRLTTWEGLKVPTNRDFRRRLARMRLEGKSWHDIAAHVNGELAACITVIVNARQQAAHEESLPSEQAPQRAGETLALAAAGRMLSDLGMSEPEIRATLTEEIRRAEDGGEPFGPNSNHAFDWQSIRARLRFR